MNTDPIPIADDAGDVIGRNFDPSANHAATVTLIDNCTTDVPCRISINGVWHEAMVVPDGMTTADVRHRLATWPVMLESLRYAHREMSADGGRLTPVTAAIAAAEEKQP